MVSICGKVPIQEAPNGLPFAVSDATVWIWSTMINSTFVFFLFNFVFIFNSMPGLFSRNFPFLNKLAGGGGSFGPSVKSRHRGPKRGGLLCV